MFRHNLIVFPRFWRTAAIFLLLVIFFPVKSFCQQQLSNQDCLTCHDGIKIKEFIGSAHGGNLCTSCHSDVREAPHDQKPGKVVCASCHSSESQIYNSSEHGKEVISGGLAANCLDCHGLPHEILKVSNPASLASRLNIPKTCVKCHEDKEKMAKYNLVEKDPYLTYSETVHGKAILEKGLATAAVCTDCHGAHNLLSPSNPSSRINRRNVPYTCGKCHDKVLNVYARSIHGKAALSGVREAPVCTDCHGEHSIRSPKDPKSSVYPTAIAEKACGQCHAAQKIIGKYNLPGNRLETYLESYHGLASKFGVTTVANCASCHGFHGILPSNDPESTVNKRNLAKTCGKCHPHAGSRLFEGSVHLSPSAQKDRAVYYVTILYILLITFTIGGMLLHNLLDFIHKFKLYYRKRQDEDGDLRFTRGERAQHMILLGSFIILAYTGFALRFRTAWWAMPFTIWDPGFDWRGIVHRVMAIVFSVLGLYHGYYIGFTKRGRKQLKALLPCKKDIFDVIDTLKYNLGLRKEEPRYKTYNYIEKAEYWALVWGSLVMIVTGAMLTFENFCLQYFPKWVLDVARTIHYFEAILAVSAIIVWHFYFIFLDPKQYPLNLSMFTGKASKEEKRDNDEATP